MKYAIAAFFLATFLKGVAAGQAAVPPHYRGLVRMADCTTLACLDELRKTIPADDRTADLVFFSKRMTISSSKEAAAGLLRATPANEGEQMMFINFTSWLDGVSESQHDMETLAKIYEEWPKLVAKAALLRPDLMRYFVGYLRFASFDIHSDFTGNAAKVCHKERATFGQAFAELARDEQSYIRKNIFDPTSCTAVFRSEAE